MNYFEIGQRIRKFRKANNLSQEELAEKIGISTTHMSHIETGNTKLSLPVLVELAKVLEVRTDDLIFDANKTSRSAIIEEVANNLESCTVQQLNLINDIIITVKTSLSKYM
ncbi:MAG: helix-turn-helix transcriptional regulator [Clostridia bacterium]|nr:helix-turn-helix transcriptional regulator [Clostridia bacterium]